MVAGWMAAQKAAEKEHLDFHVVAFNARNKEHEPDAGTFEARLLTDLTQQVKSGGEPVLSRIDTQTNCLHFMRAIRLDESCMSCHGDPKVYDKSGTGKDALGFVMENWPVGHMHGAYEVRIPLEAMDEQVGSFLQTGVQWTIPLVLIGTGVLALVLRNLLSRPVKALIGAIDVAAKGDLRRGAEIRSSTEIGWIGQRFTTLVDSLRGAMVEVSGVTNEVASAATQIAASAEEMSCAIGEVAQQSTKTALSADRAGALAAEGGATVAGTVERMKQLESTVGRGAACVSTLGRRGEEIGQVIAVINDIADQTNLLALNAAIEAARAGEHGRGFAVVADEVRKLADRTTKATEEIGTSIRSIQDETGLAVREMTSGSEEVRAGVGEATRAGASLQQIVASASEVASMVTAISAASEEAGAGASQSASAGQQLSQKAEQLRALVQRFRID